MFHRMQYLLPLVNVSYPHHVTKGRVYCDWALFVKERPLQCRWSPDMWHPWPVLFFRHLSQCCFQHVEIGSGWILLINSCRFFDCSLLFLNVCFLVVRRALSLQVYWHRVNFELIVVWSPKSYFSRLTWTPIDTEQNVKIFSYYQNITFFYN